METLECTRALNNALNGNPASSARILMINLNDVVVLFFPGTDLNRICVLAWSTEQRNFTPKQMAFMTLQSKIPIK
jgi:hypothetical protein